MKLALFVLAVVLTGCSMSGMRWSSPAPQGHGRVGIVPEFRTAQTNDRPARDRPDLRIEYRRGVSPTWDFGGHANLAGLGLDARGLIAKSDAVDASAGLGVRGGLPTHATDTSVLSSYEFAIEPALRVGANIGPKSQLALGIVPSLVFVNDVVYAASGEKVAKPDFVFVPEMTLAIDIGVSDSFHIAPQIGAASFIGVDSFTLTDDSIRLRAALGFYF